MWLIVSEVEGITVADRSIPSTFSSNPRCYGGIELTRQEEKVLCLPPRFAFYEKINLMSCKNQIEKGLAKLRWSALRNVVDEISGSEEIRVERGEGRAWPFDVENGAFHLRYLRPPDLPFNKRVCLSNVLEGDKEIDMQHLRRKLMRVTEEYVDEQGRKIDKGDLTSEEQQRLRSLRSKGNAAIVFQTDKSGRFAVDTLVNYRVACQPHVENDHTVAEEMHERVQAEANAHSVLWVR